MLQANPFLPRKKKLKTSLYDSVVMALLLGANCLNKGHHIFFDNFYTTVFMFLDLLVNFGTLCTGTLRLNRKGLPKDLMVTQHKELKERGETQFRVNKDNKDMTLTVWKDTKIVHLLSTAHGSKMGETNRKVRNKASGQMESVPVPCPEAITDYTRNMGGVDLSDQMYQYYNFARKSHKWTIKLFFYIFQLMIVNALVMYNSTRTNEKDKLSLYDFMVKCIGEMAIEALRDLPKTRKDKEQGPNDRLTNRCMPGEFPNRSRCHVCYMRAPKEKKDGVGHTIYGCHHCGKHLHMPHCFSLYHTEENYAKCQLPDRVPGDKNMPPRKKSKAKTTTPATPVAAPAATPGPAVAATPGPVAAATPRRRQPAVATSIEADVIVVEEEGIPVTPTRQKRKRFANVRLLDM